MRNFFMSTTSNEQQLEEDWKSLPTSPCISVVYKGCYSVALAHQDQNRYHDVLPYNKTRVKLSDPSSYINASYIEVCPKYRFIAAQAPLPQSFGHWWEMIWEKGALVVVMLSRFIEKRKVKAHCYWPSSKTEPEKYGEVTVLLQKKETSPLGITTRYFILKKGDETRTVMHLHFTEWPDFGVPDSTEAIRAMRTTAQDFIQLHTPAKTPGQLRNKSYPIVVHCSAGIGRAGTFLAFLNYCEFVRLGNPPGSICVPDIVAKLRNQRMCMVQTKEQFQFIYSLIRDELGEDHADSSTYTDRSDTLEDSFEPNQEKKNPRSKNFFKSSQKKKFCGSPRSFLRTTQVAMKTRAPVVSDSSSGTITC